VKYLLKSKNRCRDCSGSDPQPTKSSGAKSVQRWILIVAHVTFFSTILISNQACVEPCQTDDIIYQGQPRWTMRRPLPVEKLRGSRIMLSRKPRTTRFWSQRHRIAQTRIYGFWRTFSKLPLISWTLTAG